MRWHKEGKRDSEDPDILPMRTCTLVYPLGAQAVRRPGFLLECYGEDLLGKFSR
jgi:hypothetical protein